MGEIKWKGVERFCLASTLDTRETYVRGATTSGDAWQTCSMSAIRTHNLEVYSAMR